MKGYRFLRKCVIIEVVIIFIAIINLFTNIISIPADSDMIDFQFSILTVSTVFVGFSFTALGMLLGFASDKLVESLKNTDFMLKNSSKLVLSIIFFSVSIIISLGYIIGIDKFMMDIFSKIPHILKGFLRNLLFINCIGYLVAGFIQYLSELRELYRLISHIYAFKIIPQEKKDKFFTDFKQAKQRGIEKNEN